MEIKASYQELSFSVVDPDPDQPRQDFNETDILELAISIQENTLLQAVSVKPHPTIPGRYMIVAGERRLRAMKEANLTKAVFKVLSGPGIEKSYILSAIENLHRVNLNPIEEATCYQRLHDEEGLTWEEIHELIGRDVSVILNKIKLLTLPPEIQAMVRKGDLPQVTALNLSQWRNEEGHYLRMAHDLINGRDPAELHFREQTAQGERLVQAKLPKNPDDYASRIVKLSGRVQSMPAVLEGFLRLPDKEKAQVIAAIDPSVLGKLRQRFIALYRAIQAVSEFMESSSRPSRRQPLKVSPAPIPPASPVNPPERVVKKKQDQAGETPPEQDLALSFQVLSHLFYFRGSRRVDLSRLKLRNAIGDNDSDLNVVVRNALRSARERWRMPPKGNELEQKFIRLVAKLRHDFGDPTRFDDFLLNAEQEDGSNDPVPLGVR